MLTVLMLGAPEAVSAQPQPGVIDVEREGMGDEQARAHFDVGRSLYDAGRFTESAEEWEKAYALSNRAELLYNIYVAYRDANDTAKAADALERYLASDVVPESQRLNLQARLEALREAQQNEAAAEPVDTPPAATTEVTPAPEPEPTPAPAVEREPSLLPYVLVGVGGALVVGGIATGIVASGKVSDIEDACPNDVCPASYPLDDERADARLFVTMTDVLVIGGVVTAGVGAALWLLAADESPDDAPRAALGCGPGGCMATVSGRL